MSAVSMVGSLVVRSAGLMVDLLVVLWVVNSDVTTAAHLAVMTVAHLASAMAAT